MLTDNILSLIGNTPLIKLTPMRYRSGLGLSSISSSDPQLKVKKQNIYAKAEFLNPGGSIKDRVALAMIEGAERDGFLNKDSVILEPTSGNTGIGISLVGGLKGYKVKIVMPENMSEERKKLMLTLGADLILTPAEKSLPGAVKKVAEIQKKDKNTFVLQQFENPNNPKVHYEETAHELWRQMNGEIDCFVAGVGSGGTLQGVGKFLKEQNKNIKIVAVEPKNVSALLGHEPGLHQIQGIGDGFIPAVLDVSLVDEVLEVTDEDAIKTTRKLGKEYGLLVGISSGANVWAAEQLSPKIKGNIATVLPDRAERYFSTALI